MTKKYRPLDPGPPSVLRTFEEARLTYFAEETIALDIETGGFSPWNDPIHVITLYGPVSNAITILHYPRDVPVPQEVLDWLAGFPEIVTHNGVQFDLLFLANNGMAWDRPRIYDTMIGELSVLEVDRRDRRVNLADTAKRRLGVEIDKTINHGGWGDLILSPDHVAYVKGDIRSLIDMKAAQAEKAATKKGLPKCLDVEMALAYPIIRMELNGMPIDRGAVAEYFEGRVEHFREVILYLNKELGPILLSSHPQLKKALAERFDAKLFPSTRAEILMDYARLGGDLGEVCQALLDWRAFSRRQSMFSDAWQMEHVVWHGDNDPRIHAKFWQIGTNTGRFSSSNPNIQQIPRDMRHCFGNRDGIMVGKTDYAAIEVRVAAVLAGDQSMIRAFNNGEDIHRVVAAAGFQKRYEDVTAEERKIAKAMSFTLLFGGGAPTFRSYAKARGSEIDEDAAQMAVDNFFERFPAIREFRDLATTWADLGKPKTLTYPTGLRRLIRGEELKATTILNNLVQGTAAAGLKFGMIEMERSGVSKHLAAVVHDECVYTAPDNEIEDVREEIDRCLIIGMKEAIGTEVKIGVESTYGRTWVGDHDKVRVTEA